MSNRLKTLRRYRLSPSEVKGLILLGKPNCTQTHFRGGSSLNEDKNCINRVWCARAVLFTKERKTDSKDDLHKVMLQRM